MKTLQEIIGDQSDALWYIQRAKSGIEVPELHAIVFWWENSRLKLHYHLNSEPTEESEEELRCITTEVMSDYDISIVDETWGKELPAEREDMVTWIINPL